MGILWRITYAEECRRSFCLRVLASGIPIKTRHRSIGKLEQGQSKELGFSFCDYHLACATSIKTPFS
jgi:hypothetical protein